MNIIMNIRWFTGVWFPLLTLVITFEYHDIEGHIYNSVCYKTLQKHELVRCGRVTHAIHACCIQS